DRHVAIVGTKATQPAEGPGGSLGVDGGAGGQPAHSCATFGTARIVTSTVPKVQVGSLACATSIRSNGSLCRQVRVPAFSASLAGSRVHGSRWHRSRRRRSRGSRDSSTGAS